MFVSPYCIGSFSNGFETIWVDLFSVLRPPGSNIRQKATSRYFVKRVKHYSNRTNSCDIYWKYGYHVIGVENRHYIYASYPWLQQLIWNDRMWISIGMFTTFLNRWKRETERLPRSSISPQNRMLDSEISNSLKCVYFWIAGPRQARNFKHDSISTCSRYPRRCQPWGAKSRGSSNSFLKTSIREGARGRIPSFRDSTATAVEFSVLRSGTEQPTPMKHF